MKGRKYTKDVWGNQTKFQPVAVAKTTWLQTEHENWLKKYEEIALVIEVVQFQNKDI